MSRTGIATIMFTDIVDSTRMREQLGDGAADELGRTHDVLITDAVAAFDGRVIKTLGDGALAEFSSAVDAVSAADAIQAGLAAHNAASDSGRKLGVRIGIHAGEVVHEDGDISGLPVAIASRVCGAAEGGQILVTTVVRSLIGRRAQLPLASVGVRQLKGVEEPMELWLVGSDAPLSSVRSHGDVPFPAFLDRGIPKSLVGRSDQLAQLDAAYQVASDRSRLAVVIGEPGIGKTALTSSWSRGAADGGALVVGGRCTPDAALPYQPFIEIARSILKTAPEMLRNVGPAAGNLALLVPSIASPAGLPPPVQTDSETTTYLMAEAVACLLKPKGDGPATVAILDDLHWAEAESVAVLSHLARYAEGLRLLIIGTYRDTDIVRGHPLPVLLTDLRRGRRLDRVQLERLPREAVAVLVRDRVGSEAPDNVVESISKETQGNPFFIEEMTMHLEDEGALAGDGRWIADIPIEEFGIPEGVREVVGLRLDRLGEDANRMLEVGAVIGPRFTADVAGEVAGLDERQVDEVLDAAVDAGVLTEGDSADEFAFSHALMRQTLYEALSARRRIRLHRAVGGALEEHGAPAAETLFHWLNSNESDRALAAAVRAATEARKASAQADVTGHLETALELWEDVDDPEALAETTHAELVRWLVDDYYDFGDQKGVGLELIERELTLVGSGDDRIRGLLMSSLSSQLWIFGRQKEGIAAVEESLRLVPASPASEDRATVLAVSAGQYATSDLLDRALETGLEAKDMSIEVGSDINLARALTSLGTAYGQKGRMDEAEQCFEELADVAQRTGRLRDRSIVFVNLGDLMRINGSPERALELFDEGIALSQEFGMDRWVAMLQGNAAQVLFGLGKWNEAKARLAAAPSLDFIDHPELNVISVDLQIAGEQGDDATWTHLVGRLQETSIDELDPQIRGSLYEALVSHSRWSGDYEEGFELARSAIAGLTATESYSDSIQLTVEAIELVADAIALGVAGTDWLEAAESWILDFETVDRPVVFLTELRAHAAADLARGRGANSPELWAEAVSSWGRVPYYGAKARYRYAQALNETNPADPRIAESLEEARRLAVQLEAKPLLGAIGELQAAVSS